MTDEVEKYRECSACNCTAMWSWQGLFEGCAEMPVWASHDCCYVQGGPNCLADMDSTLADEDKMYTRDVPRRLTGLDMTGAMSRAGVIAIPPWIPP